MKVVASWGSSGAGKTAVALSLAAQAAAQKIDTLVISVDSRTPALPVYLPMLNFSPYNSIGPILESNETLTEGALKDKIHRHPKSDRLYFMGLISGETASITYKAAERMAVISLFHLLRDSPFQLIIIDCDSNPIYDNMTLYGLESADVVLRTVSPDVKGFEFQKAQLSWMGNNENFRWDEHIKIVNSVDDTSPLKAAEALFGGFDYILPYSQEIKNKMAAGELLHGFHGGIRAIKYENQISKLLSRIMEDANG